MGRKVPICLPSLNFDFFDNKKAEKRKGHNDIDNSNMENPGMVLPTIEYVQKPLSTPHQRDLLLDPSRIAHPLILSQ